VDVLTAVLQSGIVTERKLRAFLQTHAENTEIVLITLEAYETETVTNAVKKTEPL
jgi:hypothetical protein